MYSPESFDFKYKKMNTYTSKRLWPLYVMKRFTQIMIRFANDKFIRILSAIERTIIEKGNSTNIYIVC